MDKQIPQAPAAKPMEMQARICSRGHVYLYVGHTCLFLRQEEFLDVARIVHAVENHLFATFGEALREQTH